MKFILLACILLLVGCGKPLTQKEVTDASKACVDMGMRPEYSIGVIAVYSVICIRNKTVPQDSSRLHWP